MTSFHRFFERSLALFLLVVICVTGLGSVGVLKASATVESKYGSDSLVRTSLEEIQSVLTSATYSAYLQMYGDAPMADDVIHVDFLNGVDLDDTTSIYNIVKRGDDLKPYNDVAKNTTLTLPDGVDAVLLCGDSGKITFKINVKKSAFYNLHVNYFTGNVAVYDVERDEDGKPVLKDGVPTPILDGDYSYGNYAAMERYVMIDGTVPYSEARSVEFSRIWADLYELKNEDGTITQMRSDSEAFKQYLRDHGTDYENYRPFMKDGNGNELKPEKILASEWAETFVYDSTGYFNDPLKFYLSEGEHTISFMSVRETAAISSITLETAASTPSYAEYYASKGGDSAVYHGDAQIYVQAEYPTRVSERTIYQLNNRSSVITQPQDPAEIRLNAIGGEKWEYVGQWIEWYVEVPEAGFYNIIPRSKQGFYSGMYVSRKVYINGELPFNEAKYLQFKYDGNWVTNNLSDGENEFLFYLEAGANTIRMEVVLGDMASILSRVNTSLQAINSYYRKILMITGTDPDEYRDYRFERLIPDVLKGLRAQSAELYDVSAQLAEMMGGMGSHSATLDRVANVCGRMGEYPTLIASYLDTLKTYTASLGTWLADTQNQPLDLDYLCLQAPEKEAPEAEPGFFKAMWGEVQKFIMSFFSDYDSLGSVDNGASVEHAEDYAVEVWTVTSRDQAQIIRNLVDDTFTPTYGIPVVVKLVAGGTLLPATLAGTGPDVYMGAGQGDAINYAIRSAVLSLNNTSKNTDVGYNFNDLSRWADDPVYGPLIEQGVIPTFDEVTSWFSPAAMTPLTLYGQAYGIPQTMSFSMMFYRKDIFAELGVAVPDTWDDFYNIIYTLQAAELDIGHPTGIAGSTYLMYQQNEPYYDEGNYDYYLNLFRAYYEDVGYDKSYDNVDDYLESIGYTYTDAEGNVKPTTDGMTINLDSDVSLAAFKRVCELFTMYDFPVTYDFANRFRSGEMPLAIADYSSYNTLIVFAPEINGLWEFTPLPGTLYEDPVTGEAAVNNTTIGAVSAMVMMRSVTEKNALGAWCFMQWWMNEDSQTSFGNEMIALLGPSAKQATANINALRGMSWSKDEYDNLFAQFNAVACTPEYPGSYIIARYTNFAFLNVVNKDENPVESMQSYITDINNELTRKRAEFHLPTSDTIKEMEQYAKDHKFYDKILNGGD